MAETKIVALGYVAETNSYKPISVSDAGFINVHITNSIPLEIGGALGNNADAQAVVSTGLLGVENYGYVFNGATYDRARGSKVFKTASVAAAGDTAIWTPASGKKFRLMGYTISVCGTLAVLGVEVITLKDNATIIFNHVAGIGATVSGDTQIAANLGQGYLSVSANNPLRINLGTVLTAGAVTINAWGTEE